MRHQLAHRGLEVVVADGPARDAGRARADCALVEDQDVRAPAEPAGPQFPAKVPGRGEPVDACADDHVPAVRGDHGPAFQIPGTRGPSISMPKSWPTDTSASNRYRPCPPPEHPPGWDAGGSAGDGMLYGHTSRPRPPREPSCSRQPMRTGSPSASSWRTGRCGVTPGTGSGSPRCGIPPKAG